jgi:hypothetical protein
LSIIYNGVVKITGSGGQDGTSSEKSISPLTTTKTYTHSTKEQLSEKANKRVLEKKFNP